MEYAMTIVYVLISVILGAVLGYGLAWGEGFWQMARANRRPPVAPEPPEEWSDSAKQFYKRVYNRALTGIAEDMERAGNKVLAWQIRKKIKV